MKIPCDDKLTGIDQYEKCAADVRKMILDLVTNTGSPHVGPSFSIVEILIALYFDIMNVSPGTAEHAERDRFILSKGHACPALYAVLFKRGFLSEVEINGFGINNGSLQQHPDRNIRRGIELSTGSLGHGLSVGAGMALSGKVKKNGNKVFVLLGDGELNEGTVWEAALFGGQHKLSNLVAIIDHNGMQALGRTQDIIDLEPLSDKWKSFGWNVQTVDGHDFGQIFNVFDNLSKDLPNTIILNTVKGKGVSFMEHDLLWHYRYPHGKEYDHAVKELDK